MSETQSFTYVEHVDIAAGGTATLNFNTDAGRRFVIEKVLGLGVLNGAFGAAITGSPLARNGDPLIANNTNQSLGHIFAAVTSNQDQLTDGEVPLVLLAGDGQMPSIRLSQPVLNGNVAMRFDLRNAGPAAVTIWIALEGHFDN